MLSVGRATELVVFEMRRTSRLIIWCWASSSIRSRTNGDDDSFWETYVNDTWYVAFGRICFGAIIVYNRLWPNWIKIKNVFFRSAFLIKTGYRVLVSFGDTDLNQHKEFQYFFYKNSFIAKSHQPSLIAFARHISIEDGKKCSRNTINNRSELRTYDLPIQLTAANEIR